MEQYPVFHSFRTLSASNDGRSNSSDSISPFRLVLALLCPLIVIFFSIKFKLQIERDVIISVTRTIVQLLFAGCFLLGFVFSFRSPILVFLYLMVMALIASLEVTARQVRTYVGHFGDSLISVLVGGGLIGAYGSIVVFHPTPWWEPHVMVPTAGMIIGNAISGPALAVDRLLAEVSDKRHEPETRLAFGSTGFEAILPTVRASLKAAIMPGLNQMAVIGLVSIPGMMTGQLLGGASPLAAAEYQMAITWLICGTGALSTFTALYLACNHAVVDLSHRLTPERVIGGKKKMSIDVAAYQAISSLLKDSISAIRSCMGTPLTAPASSSSTTSSPMYSTLPTASDSLHGGGSGSDSGSALEDGLEMEPLHSSMKERGRVSVSLVDTHLRPCVSSVFFDIAALNILSHDRPLFPPGGISLRLAQGERVAIQGPSGIGKTRLLRAIAKLDSPLGGACSFIDALSLSVPAFRTRCIYVPQAIPPLAGSPKEFVEECCSFGSRSSLPSFQALKKDVISQLSSVEASLSLTSGKLSEAWIKLSGGERQRAAIAVALLLLRSPTQGSQPSASCPCPWPSLILLDEPTAACDPQTALAVEAALLASGLSVLFITHDQHQASRLAHRILALSPLSPSSISL